MLKLSKKKKNACLALAVLATVLGGGSVFAAEHNHAIIESFNYGDDTRQYWEDTGIINDFGYDDNTYNFKENTVLVAKASNATYNTSGSDTYEFRGIFKSGDSDSVINMNGHRLDVAMDYDNPGSNCTRPAALNLYGISVTGGNLTINDVTGMDLSANGSFMTASSKLTGIYVAGTRNPDEGKASLTINNSEGWENAIKFYASDSGNSQIERGIYVWKNTGTANLNVSGLVDIDSGDATALDVKGGWSGYQGNAETVASIGGGQLKSTNTAIFNNGGFVYINSSLGDNGIVENTAKQDVQIDGDIIVKDAATKYNPSDEGRLTLALNTADSHLNGTILSTYYNGIAGKSEDGDAYVALKNGATWTNAAKGSNHGSNLTQFVGGDSASSNGYIYQKDSSTLNLGDYSGYTTIFYEHGDNDGTETAHYTAGDTVVNTAKAGSNITLVTNNVSTTDATVWKSALNALAGKLYYTGFKNGEKNLSGTVSIADGLTASRKDLKTGYITFNENGQGTYVPVVKKEFTTTITAAKDDKGQYKDEEYVNADVIQADGTYKFANDTTITNKAAIDTTNDLTIVADKTLNLVSDNGIAINVTKAGNKLDIKAGKLVLKTSNSNGALQAGTSTSRKTVNINGDVDITATNNGGVYGIFADNADVTVDGSIKADIDGGAGYWGMAAGAAAISSRGSTYNKYASNVNVNGNVDITANGNGLQANAYGAILTVNGGGQITVNDPNNIGYAALRADNGTVNMNVKLEDSKATAGLGNDVVLKGNLAATDGCGPSDTKASIVNVALDTEKSSLEGVAYTAGSNSEINLWLQNNASWTNEVHGATEKIGYGESATEVFNGTTVTNFTGGVDAANAGNIFQKDSNALKLGNYSGYTNIFYVHDNKGEDASDYKAGDTIITTAKEGSVVNMITDSENITFTEKDSVAKVLNALAGKLTYSDYPNAKENLKGYVKIAEGLTSSSFKKTGDITFDETGKGTYVQPPVVEKSEFTTAITGRTTKDTEYEGNIDSDGKYFFSNDSTITIENAKNNAAGIDLAKDATIKADKDLTVKVTGDVENSFGVSVKQGQTADITAKNLHINVTNTGETGAISVNNSNNTQRASLTINGNLDMNVKHDSTKSATGSHTLGAYANQADLTINGDVKSVIDAAEGANVYYGASHLYATSAQGEQKDGYKGGNLVVKGNVDLSGSAQGLFANIGGATVTVNGGGKIVVKADDSTRDNGYAALRAEDGTVNMNVALENGKATGGLGNDVTITGNIAATTGAVNKNDVNGTLSTVNLALDTEKSVLTGVAVNGFDRKDGTTGVTVDGVEQKFNGEINLWLQNGATWNNEQVSTIRYYSDNPYAVGFQGSHVANFTGGTSEAAAGNIFQKDSEKLTFDNYSGYTNIFYAHEGNGEAAENYTAGDTIIKTAQAGSVVNMITDNGKVNMSSKESVNNVLNALAGKLYYSDYVNGKADLAGYVKIAEGLTSSSIKKTGDITFSENGQGTYVPVVKKEFTTTITGDAKTDEDYKKADVIQDDGTYKFENDTTITNKAAIDTTKDLTIVADKTLTLISDNGVAINVAQAGNKLDIKADKLVLKTSNSLGALNAGTDSSRKTVTITGDVDITSTNGSDAYGIYAKHADITVNGNVKANVDSGYGAYNCASGAAISARGTYSPYYKRDYASNVTVNGNVDITANGNGLQANGNGATLTVNGGGQITVNDTYKLGYSALRADNGTVNMNVKLEGGKATAGLGNDVVLKGNLAATNGTSDAKASIINVALDTEKSSLEGVAYTAGSNSEINLWLQNNASWTNEVHGATEKTSTWTPDGYIYEEVFNGSTVSNFTGGIDAAHAGNIFQKDSNALTLGNYSGYTNIYYAHEGNGETAENYTAGDTIITTAQAGSVVNMITDNEGVNLKEEKSINNVLNALAGKLIYSDAVNGKTDLAGYVKIAGGLTASDKILETGNIAFNQETGKGALEAGTVTPGPIYPEDQEADEFSEGITGDDKLYKQEGVLKDGVYTFTKNPTEITVDSGAAVTAANSDITIKTKDAVLTLNGKDQGILADDHKVSVSGNVNINGETGVSVANGGSVLLEGITNITSSGTNAIDAVDGKVTLDSIADIKGDITAAEKGSVKLTGGSAVSIKGDINADGGSISINKEQQSATTTIEGSVNAANDGAVDIALVGAQSKMTGGYAIEDGSSLNMTVKNGATWNFTGGEGEGLSLVGGATKGAGGYIFMNDNAGAATQSLRAAKAANAGMDIANYEGWETFIYAHENDGDEVSDYTAGDVTIRNAKAGSGVVLSTDSSNINMKSKDAVEGTLKALAQKVTYSDHAANGSNLTGQVQIADGLTSSSVSKYLGTMSWDNAGKGQYNLDSVNWSEITEGDYETFVMKGVRSAATTSLHSWRDNMQDTYTGADLADEDGIFAKALGGKTTSDVKGVHDSNTYYGVQVGYDKALDDNTHVGVAFDYRDGDSKYLLGGEGDNQLYSLGFYGVKKFADDSFFRVAAKVGRVENEYDVYNEIRSMKLHGDYKANAYGLTMEYGKTFGKDEAYITPKAQLTWAQVGGKDYSAATAKGATLDVSQDSYQSLVGRLGFEAGVKNSKGNVYAGFYAAHEFNGDISASYMAEDGGAKRTSFDGEDTWMEMAVGGRYSVSDNCQLYADFARDFNGDFQRKWKANVGLRFEF